MTALVCAIFAATAQAAPTTIDSTFGTDGLAFVTTLPGADNASFEPGNAVELPGGYATVDRRCGDEACETVVTRLDDDGQPATGFGTAGEATVTHSTYEFAGRDLVLTDSGDLLVVGHVLDTDLGVQSLASALVDGDTGALIGTHGVSGFEIWGDWASNNSILRVKLGPGGFGYTAIANAEVSAEQVTLVVGFEDDGSRTSSFVVDAPGDSHFIALDLATATPDLLYLSGIHVDGMLPQAAVMRLDGGVPDTAWSTDGVAPVAGSGFGAAARVELIPSGGAVAAGVIAPSLTDASGFVTRLDTNGNVDTGFGDGGVANCTAPLGGTCQFTSLDLTATGRIIAGGAVNDAGVESSLIMRLTGAGQPDASFVAGGEHVFNVGIESHQVRQLFDATGEKLIFRAYAIADDGGDGLAGAALGRLEGGDIPTPPGPGPGTGPEPGPDPVTPPGDEALAVKIATKSKLKASKFKAVIGTATGSELKRVELAINRVDAKLLKRSKKCLFLKNPRGAFSTVGARGGKCLPVRALRAKGTRSWSYKLSKPLKPGKYVIHARPVDDDEGRVVTKKLTLVK